MIDSKVRDRLVQEITATSSSASTVPPKEKVSASAAPIASRSVPTVSGTSSTAVPSDSVSTSAGRP